MSAKSMISRNNACRICLDVKTSDIVSFDDGNGWLDMYEFCFGLKISSQDIPRKLCGICAGKMEDFYKFINKAIKSDQLWKNIISVSSEILPDTILISSDDGKPIQVKEENTDLDFDASTYDNCYSEYDVEQISMKQEDEQKETLLQAIASEKYIENPNDTCKHLERKLEKNKLFICKLCNHTFKFEKTYKTHLRKRKCKIHKCNEKKKKAKLSVTTLNEDILKVENQSTITSKLDSSEIEIRCGLCDESSLNRDNFKQHLELHRTNNDLACKLCDFTGKDFAHMVAHRYSHLQHPNKGTRLNCYSCEKKCQNLLLLQFHFRSVHLNKPGGWCPVCNKVYTNYKKWKDHEHWHTSSKFICDHCGRKFVYRHQIELHFMDHAGYRAFVCDICGNKFKRITGLKLHLAQAHDNKAVKCTHCNKTFKNKMNLKIHLQREARAKIFQCEFCSKCYSNNGELRSHMVWHKDVRPYACHICENAYKAKSQLKIHMRNHTGEVPFKCTVPNCPKAFASSQQLKVHLNVHTGIRRFKCQYCDKTFHNRINVLSHCAKAHNVNIVWDKAKNEYREAKS